ncbi:hypothetical protein CO2235_100027 [Cupriavidus oxalaticus]|uniref:Uncharacterized protein n=1 Tax=Cupriavidus oxalaticus TaxID=96344 RepID=A0A375FZW0_9BURK|nr:hypothetical protein CO2235_100027 [Cupriavidus oxalaticus]
MVPQLSQTLRGRLSPSGTRNTTAWPQFEQNFMRGVREEWRKCITLAEGAGAGRRGNAARSVACRTDDAHGVCP